MLGNASRPGTAASNSTPAPRRQRAGPAAAAAMFETHTLLGTTPPNQPPSLRQRQFSTSDLFQYYALRGYAELLHSPQAVEACLSATTTKASARSQSLASPRADQTSIDEAIPTNAAATTMPDTARSESPDVAALAMTSGSAGRNSTAITTPEYVWLSATQPTRRPTARPSVVAVALESHMLLSHHPYHIGAAGDVNCAELQPRAPSQPISPRLRPPCGEDFCPSLVQQREELARRRALQQRRLQQTLPTLQSFYGTLYLPMTGDSAKEVHSGAVDIAAAVRSRTSSPFTGPPQPPPSPSRIGTTPGSPTSVRAFAQSQPRHLSFAAEAEVPNVDAIHDASGRYGMHRGERNAAAVLRQCQAALAKEVEDDFVAAHELAHPELAEARRFSTRFAATTATMNSTGTRRGQSGKGKKSGKGSRAQSAALPPQRAGAPPPNLHFFSLCLFLSCDAQGQVSAAEFERLLASPPFEVHYVDAVRSFFHLVHPLTEARGPTLSQHPSSPQITALANGEQPGSGYYYGPDAAVMSAHAEENSISVGSTTPRGHANNNNNNSGGSLKLHTPSSTLPSRRALGNSLSYHPHHRRSSTTTINTSGSRAGSPQSAQVTNTNNNAASNIRASSPQDGHLTTGAPNTITTTNTTAATLLRENAFVLVRELLAALDALLNSAETRLVVRWTCFNVLAQEGNGLIRKATLQALRRQRHGECDGGQAEVTASIVKALSDGFEQLAQEEEVEYMAAMSKGKKRRGKAPKLPALQPHQKSVIPLHLMRRSHMDFTTFCRFFDELPSFAAAFAHVWLPLLLTGHIVPPPMPPPTTTPHHSNTATATAMNNVPAHHNSNTNVNNASPSSAALSKGAGNAMSNKPDNSSSRLMGQRAGAGAGPASRASKTSFVVASTMATGNENIDTVGADIEMVAAQSLSSNSGALNAAATLRPLATTVTTTTTISTTLLTGSVTEIEPNTYPLIMLGDAITRRSLLRRLVHNRIEELRRGAEHRRRRPTQMQPVMEVSVRDEATGRAASEAHA